MSCGCNDEGKILIPVATACAQAQLDSPPCNSQSGKFHDRSIEDFTVPAVGKISNLHVCQANLWGAGQYVGIVIGKSKYGFFRITEVGERVLKVLNGCEKGNSISKIAGNPEAGTVIPEGAVVFPAPPFGCSDYLAEQFMLLLETSGADGVIKILNESDEICFTATPDLDTDPDYRAAFLFGGDFIGSCLRKIKKIFTGQGGSTLCFPYMEIVNEESVVFQDVLSHKYLAYIDEKGCIKRGKPAKCVVNDRKTFKLTLNNLYEGHTTTAAYTWDALGAPSPSLCGGTIAAELELILSVQDAGATGTVMNITVNGTQHQVAYVPEGESVFITRRIFVYVNAGTDVVTLQCNIQSGTPVIATGKVTLIGFHA